MSWTYSGDPSKTYLDRYRFLIGDTDNKRPIMQDEEIQFIIAEYPTNENRCLYELFSRVALLYARDIKRSLGPQTEDPTERLKFFERKVEEYRKKCVASGISLPPYKQPKVFQINMHNNPPYSNSTGGALDV